MSWASSPPSAHPACSYVRLCCSWAVAYTAGREAGAGMTVTGHFGQAIATHTDSKRISTQRSRWLTNLADQIRWDAAVSDSHLVNTMASFSRDKECLPRKGQWFKLWFKHWVFQVGDMNKALGSSCTSCWKRPHTKQVLHKFFRGLVHHHAGLHIWSDMSGLSHRTSLCCPVVVGTVQTGPMLEEHWQWDARWAGAGRGHATGQHVPVGRSLFTHHLVSTTEWRRLIYSPPYHLLFARALFASCGLCHCSRVHEHFLLQDLSM